MELARIKPAGGHKDTKLATLAIPFVRRIFATAQPCNRILLPTT
jgi:hypothetical protein